MHLIKNIAEHTVHLFVGVEDSVHVWLEEKSRNRFCSSWPNESGNLPSAPFVLSIKERKTANERASLICVPSGYDWNP